MSTTISLDIIQEYIEKNKQPDTATLDYGDFKLEVKTKLTIEEKLAFVEHVVKQAFVNYITPSSTTFDVAFAIELVQAVCPELPLPVTAIEGEEFIDSQAAVDMIVALDFVNKYISNEHGLKLYEELKDAVNTRIEFENQKLIAYASVSTANTEAIETFSYAMNKVVDLLDVGIDLLEKNGNKLAKHLTPKNIKAAVLEYFKLTQGADDTNLKKVEVTVDEV